VSSKQLSNVTTGADPSVQDVRSLTTRALSSTLYIAAETETGEKVVPISTTAAITDLIGFMSHSPCVVMN
jgi:hypothetical protein